MRRLVGFSAALMALLLVSFVWREKPHARQVALEDNLASFLQQMEGETFESPDQTYRQSLKGFRSEEQDPKLGMAWAKPSWKDLTPGRSQTSSHPNLNQLEDKIVNDVVRKLGKSLEAKIESKQLLSPAHKVAKSQNSLSRTLRSRIQQDKASLAKYIKAGEMKEERLKKDEQLLKWVKNQKSSKLSVHQLGAVYAHPSNVIPQQPESGPNSIDNYLRGARHMSEQGPAGVKIETQTSIPEADIADNVYDPNRDKLESLGVNVRNRLFPKWSVDVPGSALLPDRRTVKYDNGEQALEKSGIITDSVAGMGKHYRRAIPLPAYEKDPNPQRASMDLEQGHRYVNKHGERLQEIFGVPLAAPNAFLYTSNSLKGPHMDSKQSQFPYLDGLEDNIQSKNEAEKHEPLTSLVNNLHKGSSKLEGHGVNVWGAQPSFAGSTQELWMPSEMQ